MDSPVQDVWFQWHHTVPVTCVWLLSLKGRRESGVAWLWAREHNGSHVVPVLRRAEGQLWQQPGHFFPLKNISGFGWTSVLLCLKVSDSWRWQGHACAFHGHSLLAFRPGGFAREAHVSGPQLCLSTPPLPASLITPSPNPPDAPLAQPLCFSCWMSIIISLSHTHSFINSSIHPHTLPSLYASTHNAFLCLCLCSSCALSINHCIHCPLSIHPSQYPSTHPSIYYVSTCQFIQLPILFLILDY